MCRCYYSQALHKPTVLSMPKNSFASPCSIGLLWLALDHFYLLVTTALIVLCLQSCTDKLFFQEMLQDLDPTCLKCLLKALLFAADLSTIVLAIVKQKVCLTLIVQSELYKLGQLRCLWYWLLFLLLIIGTLQLWHEQD